MRNYGKGKLESDPNTIHDNEYVTFDEYIADSFEELPVKGVKIGDRAIFHDGEKIGIAMCFSTGWVSEGKFLPIPEPSDEAQYYTVIPETIVELAKAEDTPFPEGWVMCSAPVELAEAPNLVEGQTYRITIDNTTYDMVAVYYANMDMWLGGNTSLMTDGVDTGEEYILQIAKLQNGSGPPALNLAIKGEAGSHTVKLEQTNSPLEDKVGE